MHKVSVQYTTLLCIFICNLVSSKVASGVPGLNKYLLKLPNVYVQTVKCIRIMYNVALHFICNLVSSKVASGVSGTKKYLSKFLNVFVLCTVSVCNLVSSKVASGVSGQHQSSHRLANQKESHRSI